MRRAVAAGPEPEAGQATTPAEPGPDTALSARNNPRGSQGRVQRAPRRLLPAMARMAFGPRDPAFRAMMATRVAWSPAPLPLAPAGRSIGRPPKARLPLNCAGPAKGSAPGSHARCVQSHLPAASGQAVIGPPRPLALPETDPSRGAGSRRELPGEPGIALRSEWSQVPYFVVIQIGEDHARFPSACCTRT